MKQIQMLNEPVTKERMMSKRNGKRYNGWFLLPVLLCVMILTGPNQSAAKEMIQVVPVVASVVDETVKAGIASADEGATRNLDRTPVDIDRYVPMPFPADKFQTKQKAVSSGPVKAVVYNPTTKKKTDIDIQTLNNEIAALIATEGSSGRISIKDTEWLKQINLDNWTDHTAVGNTQDYPWRVNVKLFMDFPDGGYLCSGTMIQPSYVLTAGHCVNHGNGGAWANSITVVPGYRDNWAPYGSAYATNFLSFTPWVYDGNFNFDIGVIALDRAIGSTVGWHGFGYTTNRSWYLTTLFNNAGYPAEAKYGFNGQTLFYRNGYNDDWMDNSGLPYQVRFYKPSAGGYSGSGMYVYYSDTGWRGVYAVLSISDRSTYTGLAAMDEGEFNAIRNWTGASSPVFDLTPLEVLTKPVGKADGRQLEMAYIAHNNSSASWSGNVTASVYVSKNENISASDTLVQKHSFKADFGPWSSVEVKVPLVSIPESLAKGIYYVGVILDVDDGNVQNNDSDGQDAAKVAVLQ
jgi:V8-like Glu-specific endopeptidase